MRRWCSSGNENSFWENDFQSNISPLTHICRQADGQNKYYYNKWTTNAWNNKNETKKQNQSICRCVISGRSDDGVKTTSKNQFCFKVLDRRRKRKRPRIVRETTAAKYHHQFITFQCSEFVDRKTKKQWAQQQQQPRESMAIKTSAPKILLLAQQRESFSWACHWRASLIGRMRTFCH